MSGESSKADSTLREVAPHTETQSPEAQRAELVERINQLDQNLAGRVVTRYPTESGGQVLIFNATPTLNLDNHPEIISTGVHPEMGPIIVTAGQLAIELKRQQPRSINEMGNPTGATWEQFIQSYGEVPAEHRGKRVKSVVRTIQPPEEQEVWNRAFKHAVEDAQRTKEFEQAQAKVLPQSLEFVRSLSPSNPLESQNSVSEPNRTKTPEGLRSAPPPSE